MTQAEQRLSASGTRAEPAHPFELQLTVDVRGRSPPPRAQRSNAAVFPEVSDRFAGGPYRGCLP